MSEKHSQGYPHSQETLDFIRQNIDKMSYREIGEHIGLSSGAVVQVCLRHKIKKSVVAKAKRNSRDGYHVYLDDEIKWVFDHVVDYYSYPELAKAFNETFGTTVTPHSFEVKFRSLGVYSTCMKRRIQKPKPVKVPKVKAVKPKPAPKLHRYTDIEDAWLRRNIADMTYEQLAESFNRIFGMSVTVQSVTDRCTQKLHLRRPSNGQFQKGQSIRTLPILQEVDRDGYIWIKVEDDNTIGAWKTNWVQKQRYIYEQTYGKIPEGYIVIFLDSNRTNFDPDNLYAVPRSIHARMSQNHWYTESREHTLTAIRLCELNQALKPI